MVEGERVKPLQWGRAILRAEIAVPASAVRVVVVASMGPRDFARGDAYLTVTIGPGTVLQWGRAILRAEITT